MKDPAVLFYTGDFLAGTAFFNDEQRGQYIRLLCEQHQNGHIPENHMVSICFSLGSPVIKKFVKDSEGNYFNVRMEEEIEKRANFVNSRKDNGSKGGRPKKPNGKPYGKPTKKLPENGNGNDNKILFECFWNLYDKKEGAKKRCEIKWNKLPLEIQQKIIETLPAFKAKIREKQFQPFPETYLNQERWNDDLTPVVKEEIKQEPKPKYYQPLGGTYS